MSKNGRPGKTLRGDQQQCCEALQRPPQVSGQTIRYYKQPSACWGGRQQDKRKERVATEAVQPLISSSLFPICWSRKHFHSLAI